MITYKDIRDFFQPPPNRMVKSRALKITGLNDPVYVLCLIYAFSLPFLTIMPVFVVTLLGILAIVGYKWKMVFGVWKKNKTAWCLLLLYVLYLLNLLYTNNTDETVVKLSVKFSYIMLPVFLAPAAMFNKQQIYNLLKAFIAGTTLSIVVNILISTGHFIETNNISFFQYARISAFHHPSYYSFYIGFAAMAILYLLRKKQFTNKIQAYTIFFLHAGTVFLLSSKGGILAFLFALVCESLIRLLRKSSYINIALFTGSLVLVFLIINYNTRMHKTISSVIENKTNNIEQADTRIQVWKTCTLLIPEHFWTGIGAGDTTDKLTEKYEALNYTIPAQKRLNCHNQFFQTQLSSGILASILLVLSFLFIIINPRVNFEGMIWIFLSMVFIHFLFEAMLEKQSGVQFIAFFLVLFSYQNQKFSKL